MNTWKMYDLHEKNVRMRCSDYYGRRPERDGPILVGVFIGEYLHLLLLYSFLVI